MMVGGGWLADERIHCYSGEGGISGRVLGVCLPWNRHVDAKSVFLRSGRQCVCLETWILLQFFSWRGYLCRARFLH